MATFPQIQSLLEEKGVSFKVIDLPAVARSVEDVVRLSSGQVNEQEIIKTLIAKTKDGQFVGYVLRGKDRIKDGYMERLATKMRF